MKYTTLLVESSEQRTSEQICTCRYVRSLHVYAYKPNTISPNGVTQMPVNHHSYIFIIILYNAKSQFYILPAEHDNGDITLILLIQLYRRGGESTL